MVPTIASVDPWGEVQRLRHRPRPRSPPVFPPLTIRLTSRLALLLATIVISISFVPAYASRHRPFQCPGTRRRLRRSLATRISITAQCPLEPRWRIALAAQRSPRRLPLLQLLPLPLLPQQRPHRQVVHESIHFTTLGVQERKTCILIRIKQVRSFRVIIGQQGQATSSNSLHLAPLRIARPNVIKWLLIVVDLG